MRKFIFVTGHKEYNACEHLVTEIQNALDKIKFDTYKEQYIVTLTIEEVTERKGQE